MMQVSNSILLGEYIRLVEPTDKMPLEIQPVLFGLFGEVGSVMAASKKLHREKEVYRDYRRTTVEEFGDVLWYLTAIARRLQINIEEIFNTTLDSSVYETNVVASDLSDWPVALAKRASPKPDLDPTLLKLGEAAGKLLKITLNDGQSTELLSYFVEWYIKALQAAGVTFGEVARNNADKTRGRFVDVDIDQLPTFDKKFDLEERLPRQFIVKITQRKSGKSYLQWRGVFLGDPLTDNICDEDGYRFHDVFHLAHAAVLHWSPVFRSLIKHKRKSDAYVDETQDGGRAIVVEEGLTAWVFSQAKETPDFFDRSNSVPFDLLKGVKSFVAGYEVEQCPLKLWESAILQGYRVFHQVKANNGGVVIGNLDNRTLTYRSLTSDIPKEL